MLFDRLTARFSHGTPSATPTSAETLHPTEVPGAATPSLRSLDDFRTAGASNAFAEKLGNHSAGARAFLLRLRAMVQRSSPNFAGTIKQLPGARSIGRTDESQPVGILLRLPRQNEDKYQERLEQIRKGGPFMTVEELEQNHSASQTDLDAVHAYAKAHGLEVVESDASRRTVRLTGSAGQMNRLLGVDLQDFEHPNGTYRSTRVAAKLPPELQGHVQALLGLDNRAIAQSHIRRPLETNAAQDLSYEARDIAKAYDFPLQFTGKGQSVGFIELSGGFAQDNLNKSAANNGVANPKVGVVGVDGAKNSPGQAADVEVEGDIEVFHAVAPDAKKTVYFAPNTQQGFIDAITAAAHDKTNAPKILSISWGSAESNWGPDGMDQLNQALEEAAALGISINVAAGDNGSTDKTTTLQPDFPSSSPNVTGIGGTSLRLDANGKVTSESVWNDGAQGGAGGGGISTHFKAPAWQKAVKFFTKSGATTEANRVAPDLSFVGDPSTGYRIVTGGQEGVVGGTSLGTPLNAALTALMLEAQKRSVGFGNLNPEYYQIAQNTPGAIVDITQGNNFIGASSSSNKTSGRKGLSVSSWFSRFHARKAASQATGSITGQYPAGTGPDMASGLGRPDGTKLNAALADLEKSSSGTSKKKKTTTKAA